MRLREFVIKASDLENDPELNPLFGLACFSFSFYFANLMHDHNLPTYADILAGINSLFMLYAGSDSLTYHADRLMDLTENLR